MGQTDQPLVRVTQVFKLNSKIIMRLSSDKFGKKNAVRPGLCFTGNATGSGIHPSNEVD